MTVLTSGVKEFDPLTFLSLENAAGEESEKWRAALWQDLAVFMLAQFVESLTDQELAEIEPILPRIPNYQVALHLIQRYRPHFDQLKKEYLTVYKTHFKLNTFKEKYQL